MLTKLWAKNFKSWENTGEIKLAPLTGLFGTNSSGKTSLLQLILMLKQTVESSDRSRVLHTGDRNTYVDLGTFYDLIYRHQLPGHINFGLEWEDKDLSDFLPKDMAKTFRKEKGGDLISFESEVTGDTNSVEVEKFIYRFREYQFGMQKQGQAEKYDLTAPGYELKRNRGKPWALPKPIKSYGFPDQVNAYYQNLGFLSDLVFAFEKIFENIYYLGPLREYPNRNYGWAGEQPQDVGSRGGNAIPALLASRKKGATISQGRGRGHVKQYVDERVAEWLKELNLIDSFRLHQIAENSREYEVRVRRSPSSTEVLITDVGFGVSQILPVLVLCYYAPEGSTLILEQPEIHLHPSVQAGLADVFIDIIQTRNIQIILESHSEHLLRRLQRRVAEEKLPANRAALYFTRSENGKSELNSLKLDDFGNIQNWPPNFFGDEIGELAAMTEAAMTRMIKK
ncbi:MAG: DUF3696 domain-containing protein [Anaerolineales bacterium]